MTQRLPTPGGDSGDWGDILNAFLEVSHASDGTLNPNTVGTSQLAANSVGSSQLQSGSVTTTQLAANSVTSSILANNSVGTTQLQDAAVGPTQISTGAIGTDELADGSVTNAKLDTPTQTALTTAASALSESTADNRYIQQTQLGIASGVAQLDNTGKLTTDQVPSEVVSASSSDQFGRTEMLAPIGAGMRDFVSVYDAPFNAKGDGITVADATITSGQNVLSSATHSFTTADIGKIINVTGAGTSGALLHTTISSISSGHAVLDASASTTVTGAQASFATDDTAAIQAAMTACGAIGGSNYGRALLLPVPNGQFYGITATLTIGEWIGFVMYGQGRRSSIIKQFTSSMPIVEFTQALTNNVELGEFGLLYEQQQTSASNTASVAIALNQANVNGEWSLYLHGIWIDQAYMGVGNINSTANIVISWTSTFDRFMFSRMSGGLFNLEPQTGANVNGAPNMRITRIFCQNDNNPYTDGGITSLSTLPAVQISQGELYGEDWDIEGWIGRIFVGTGNSSQYSLENLHIERWHLAGGSSNIGFDTGSTGAVGTGPWLSIKRLNIYNLTLTGTGPWDIVHCEGMCEIDGAFVQMGQGSVGLSSTLSLFTTNYAQNTINNVMRGVDYTGVTTSFFRVDPYAGSEGAGTVQLEGQIPTTALLLGSNVLPTATSAWRNRQLILTGNGTTTRDVLYQCVETAAGTYVWTSSIQVPINKPTNFAPGIQMGYTASPTANQLCYGQIVIPYGVTLSGAVVFNFGTVAGNILVGLYNSAGTLVAQSNSVAQSGTYTQQNIPFTTSFTVTTPDIYYLGVMYSSSSATTIIGISIQGAATATQGSFALPNTVTTPAAYQGAYIVGIGTY